ncbi:hypothetical protein CKO40_23740 [Halochromatium glycolicum]|uniref:DUF4258 domain-containing protein n=1 Tax=Halochromatium glycolicum TaxID=85075 RepID=A0AAJ0XCS7_9GAMM|nr:hypothetical protein [Halochromatium glycolicum]
MNCATIRFSRHAFERMFERGLSPALIEQSIATAEPIKAYPDDRPYPSVLLLAFHRQTPVHLVVARDPVTENCVVVTVYIPDAKRWHEDFKTRRDQ